MPRGASPKREREYQDLKERFQEEGRYKGREAEVASRIVNKQRSEYGETQGQKKKAREGKAPDRDLPIDNYQQKTVPEVSSELGKLSPAQIRKVRKYETQHKHRKTLLSRIDRHLHA